MSGLQSVTQWPPGSRAQRLPTATTTPTRTTQHNPEHQHALHSTPASNERPYDYLGALPPMPTQEYSSPADNMDLPAVPPPTSRMSSEPRRTTNNGNEMTFWNPHNQPRHQPSFRNTSRGDPHDAIPSAEQAYEESVLGDLHQTPASGLRHRPSTSMRSARFDTRRMHNFEVASDDESVTGLRARASRSRMKEMAREGTPPEEILRLPLTWWMNSSAKNHFVAMIGEFIGTTMFLFFAFAGTQVANIGTSSSTAAANADDGFSPLVLLYTSVSFGFSLMVNVWIFFRISGGLFNPAVTLGMWMVKSINLFRAILLVIAQLCGSLLACVLVRALFPTALNVSTTLADDVSLARGVFIEAILTAELVFAIFMLAKEKHKATFIAPIGIGLALFIAELVGVYYTGGSLNPARSFGPCAITGVWDSDHWVYWLGPAVGAVIAVCFYQFIKILEYEVANPGQDAKHEGEEQMLPKHRRSESSLNPSRERTR